LKIIQNINKNVIARHEAISLSIIRLLHSFFVRNDVKKAIFTLAYLLIITSTFAQTSNKKKVLVVPYGRFEFVADFSLEEIGEKNSISATDVFGGFQSELTAAFSNYKDENFEFVIVDAKSIKPIQKNIKRGFGKFKGNKYYAANIKSISEEDFTKFMEYHKTDFVVFINWYHIKKAIYVSSAVKRKRTPYSSHLFDYDIYNLFKQKIIGEAKFEAVGNAPSEENLDKKMLRLTELKAAYSNFAVHVIEALNRPINIK
jgi:hypothetical protein